MNPRHRFSSVEKTAVAMTAAVFAFAGCSGASTPPSGSSTAVPASGDADGGSGGSTAAGNVREIEVDSEMADCTGVAPQKCLKIRRTAKDQWEFWYSGIEGWKHQAGMRSRLRIREEQVPNPPADGSSLRWILVEVIEQTPVKP